MRTEIIKSQTPEEQELRKKLSELDKLEAELAQCELDLITLKAEMHTFEANYMRTVGVRLAELDEIEAQIAEAEARLRPKDKKSQEQAARARSQAQESAEAAGIIKEFRENKFKPSENLKKLYREVAKSIHPDLSIDDQERLRRQNLMVKANLAYKDGDEAKLQKILSEWESSPESVKGEGTAADLVRVIRKIAQVKKRIIDVKNEIAELDKSNLYKLKKKAEKAENKGRDLLAELVSQIDREISSANKCLDQLTKGRF